MQQHPALGVAVTILIVVAAVIVLRAIGGGDETDRSGVALVDPFIGTAELGNTVLGPSVPFGFAHPSPDTTKLEVDPVEVSTSGYNPRGEIVGFSQTHESGTGGGSKYGNFRVTPFVGKRRLDDLVSGKARERARPGYYGVRLTRDGIDAELSATRLAAFHRYSFPRTPDARVLLDASSVIAVLGGPNRQKPVRSEVCLVGRDRVEATVSAVDGWLHPGPSTFHASLRFDRPYDARETTVRGRTRRGRCASGGRGQRVLALASFDTREQPVVQAKVGLSFISRSRAHHNAEREIPRFSLAAVRGAAERRWEDVLERLSVEGGSERERRIFSTALFHAHVMPHDLSGENAWWRSPGPHYEDYYGLWDTHRALHPLLALLQPRREGQMVQSLVETFEHTGWMPDTRIAGNNGLTQGGSNGDVLVADALQKGIKGVDYKTAYRALQKNAEVDSPRPAYEGREVLQYKRLGYMSTGLPRSGSRTVEYAHEDYAIGRVAAALGQREDARRYARRAHSWANLWDDRTKSIRPRSSSGRFIPVFDREHTFPDGKIPSFDAPFYEGSGWQYATYVPHDVQGLIRRVGGDRRFVAWLDDFFRAGQYNAANEVTTLAPYLYTDAGRPDRTADRVRSLLRTKYGTGRNGLPGNDDAGSLSAWWLWSAIGLFPNAGEPWYYIGSPVFRRTTIDVGRGRQFVVEAPATSARRRYVRGAKLNGRPLERAWLFHREVVRGGRLTLEMGSEPGGWGTGQRPPSQTRR